MVPVPPFAKSRIVVRRNRVHHIYINGLPLVIAGLTGNPGQLQTFFYHSPRMIHAMRLIETRIAGDDLGFYVIYKLLIHTNCPSFIVRARSQRAASAGS